MEIIQPILKTLKNSPKHSYGAFTLGINPTNENEREWNSTTLFPKPAIRTLLVNRTERQVRFARGLHTKQFL